MTELTIDHGLDHRHIIDRQDLVDARAPRGGGPRAIVLDDAVEIARQPEDVFAFLLDVSRDPEWQKGLHEARFTSSGPVGVGTTGIHVAKPFGLTVEVGWRLTDLVENRRLAWTFISGPFTGAEGYELTPTPTGTRLAHRAELVPSGILRWLRPIVAGTFVTQSEEAMQTLADLLEDATPTATGDRSRRYR